MKNKKLFAILTLVCFMFTLMPVAAFAAPTGYVWVQGDEEGFDTDAVAELTAGVASVDVKVTATNSSTAAATGESYVVYAVDADGKGVAVSKTGTLNFRTAGDYTVFAAQTTDADLIAAIDALGSFGSEETAATIVAKIKTNLATTILKSYANVTIESPEAGYTLKFGGVATTASDSVLADNGFASNAPVSLELLNNGTAVIGEKLTIVKPDYVTVSPVSAKKTTTDVNGVINYVVSASRTGVFNVVFKYADAKATLTLTATADGLDNVEVVAEPAGAMNYTQADTGVDFKFTDATGNAFALGAGTIDATGKITTTIGGSSVVVAKATLIAKPATSKLTAADFKLVDAYGADAANDGVYSLILNDGKSFKEGTYTVKVTLENGTAAVATFTVAEMDDTAKILFAKAPVSAGLGSEVTTSQFVVYAFDANGVSTPLTYGDGEVEGEYSLIVNGKAVRTDRVDFFYVDDEDKYIGSTITVLAKATVDGEEFVATTTLTVVENGMDVVYKNTTAEVGVTTTLVAEVFDANGNKTAVPGTPKVVVLEKPENAYVNVGTITVDAAKNTINVPFVGSVAGEYKIQTIVVDGDKYIASTETIVVGGNKAEFNNVVVVSIGANSMIVNDTVVALDVAPFIENSRTMLQFNVLGNFGIDVQWDEATRSVIAEGNGTKVVLTLDSKVATVNGVATNLDVAPYAVNGRTVVPVGFITGTFGINNQIIAAADGSVADILFTK